ncbi:hypothetical protein K505DRAFT_370732 [Melanomma pulvis-pyrius CBS 109.77]|uniref:PARG catalytic Macro domain-containing protein n=1 Tax=Melanomma pulvis-pyrius CBS 109.77 TaxID=1314802 RepID=A0A6A6XTH6_9PLEO|nr:hypothetical protein K505DRAFT_370732 [Melanomma pulvis-pyrius CBS 109.77]
MSYLLPTHPSIPCDDPLGVLDVENPLQYQVLEKMLQSSLARIASNSPPAVVVPTLIEDIAYTIHRNGTIDIENLRQFLSRDASGTSAKTVQYLLFAAQHLSERFRSQLLETLDAGRDTVTYTGAQVDSLLAHQFLGTLSQPEGNTWGLPCFTSWFVSDPAHRQAVDGYLTTLLDHFAQGGYSENDLFVFSLQTALEMPDPSQCRRYPNLHLYVVAEESEPSYASIPSLSAFSDAEQTTPFPASTSGTPFALVAAHSEPGPGPTGTQEERLQSASLALSVSALVIPKIPNDAAVVTSEFPVHASWKGHNRTATLNGLYDGGKRPSRHYILADALPLDEVESKPGMLKDMGKGRIEREVRKLYAAFSGAVNMHIAVQARNRETCVVETSAWGCGAFGGDIIVKTMCMMIAAGMTGMELHLTLLEQRAQEISTVELLLKNTRTTAELWQLLIKSTSPVDLVKNISTDH